MSSMKIGDEVLIEDIKQKALVMGFASDIIEIEYEKEVEIKFLGLFKSKITNSITDFIHRDKLIKCSFDDDFEIERIKKNEAKLKKEMEEAKSLKMKVEDRLNMLNASSSTLLKTLDEVAKFKGLGISISNCRYSNKGEFEVKVTYNSREKGKRSWEVEMPNAKNSKE